MPRHPRLDAPGLLQHVMARGIERTKIFRNDKDRKAFLDRLAQILEETQTECYAWSILPNHFHLLLRTGQTPLSKVMRRLMTGYAVTFNKRHKRSGHLFQNRYKSIVCEEDPYLFELIRYIHLNPLRAGLVKNLKELDKYQWCGHTAILGRSKNPLIPDQGYKPNKPNRPDKTLADKTVEDVLGHFGDTREVARRRYRQFVNQGVDQGARPDLQGGGLVRSAGGNKAGLLGRKKEKDLPASPEDREAGGWRAREKGDERILGSGEFVAEAFKKTGQSYESRSRDRVPLEALAETVSKAFGLSAEQLRSGSRRRTLVQARSVLAWIAVRIHGYKGVEIAEAFSLSSPTVSRIIEKGEFLLDKNKGLRVKVKIRQ